VLVRNLSDGLWLFPLHSPLDDDPRATPPHPYIFPTMEILHLTLIGFIALISLFDSTPCTQKPFRRLQRYLLDWATLHTPDVLKQSALDALQEGSTTELGFENAQ
jgi:hypothetical protein